MQVGDLVAARQVLLVRVVLHVRVEVVVDPAQYELFGLDGVVPLGGGVGLVIVEQLKQLGRVLGRQLAQQLRLGQVPHELEHRLLVLLGVEHLLGRQPRHADADAGRGVGAQRVVLQPRLLRQLPLRVGQVERARVERLGVDAREKLGEQHAGRRRLEERVAAGRQRQLRAQVRPLELRSSLSTRLTYLTSAACSAASIASSAPTIVGP